MDQHDQQTNLPPPGLRRFVEAAREQPIVGTCVTAEAVAAGLEHRSRRNHARRIVVLSATMAVAASLVAVGLVWPLLSRDGGERESIDDHQAASTVGPELRSTTQQSQAPVLASAVRMRSTAYVEVRGPWSIALRDGTHEIELDPLPGHALEIDLPDRTLELVEGSVTIEFGDGSGQDSAAIRLHTGVAAWVDDQGGRSQISIERLDLGGESSNSVAPASSSASSAPSAAELARSAELQLAAGKRDGALAIYRQLVRKHPHASQTRGAVLDLARLLRLEGRKDEARCAYRLYLERWPNSSVRAEVESQLDRLGDGPGCRGLSPI